MKVTIDSEKCEGHQLCAVFAPEVFGADEEGYAVLLSGGTEGEVPADQAEAVENAVKSCPENAITIDS